MKKKLSKFQVFNFQNDKVINEIVHDFQIYKMCKIRVF